MTITIPKEKLEKWESLRGKGDVKDLAKQINAPLTTTYYILRTGICTSKKVAAKIIKFHADLEKDLDKIKQQLEQE